MHFLLCPIHSFEYTDGDSNNSFEYTGSGSKNYNKIMRVLILSFPSGECTDVFYTEIELKVTDDVKHLAFDCCCGEIKQQEQVLLWRGQTI